MALISRFPVEQVAVNNSTLHDAIVAGTSMRSRRHSRLPYWSVVNAPWM
jgi:hypothetical protein